MNQTIRLIKEFLIAFFQEKNEEKLQEFMTDDIYICGLPDNSIIRAKTQVGSYLDAHWEQEWKGCRLQFEEEEVLSEQMAVLCFAVEQEGQPVKCRVSGTTKEQDKGVKISSMHFSVIVADPHSNVMVQKINTQKAMRARISLEKKKMQVNDELLFYIVSNVSTNEVIEYRGRNKDSVIVSSKVAMEEKTKENAKHIHSPEEREKYISWHTQKNLITMYQDGEYQKEYEFQIDDSKHEIIWVKVVMHFLIEPESGNILLYEYVYKNDATRMKDELVKVLLNNRYEFCGSWNSTDNQFTLLNIDAKTEKLETKKIKFTEHIMEYAKEKVHPEDREYYIENSQKACELTVKDEHFEFFYRTIENGEIKNKRSAAYLYDVENKIFLLLRNDITEIISNKEEEKQKLEGALSAAKAATRAKSEFLSRMSHEIRTPMNAIMGMTAIAQENKSDFLQVSDCLDKIDVASHYLLTLLNDILEMSRIESGKTVIHESEFDFAVLMDGIRTIVEALATQNDIRYECINHADMEHFYLGDRVRIQQILVNIISNAIKFTKEGGRVRFTVNCEPSTVEDEVFFTFVIEDTGIGMSEEFMKKMFKPFTQEDGSNTSKYQGSGLGLAISKNLAERMGGSIEVESFLGIGSTFKVKLPLKRLKKSYLYTISQQVKPVKMDESMLKDCQILMAEDHPMNVMIAKRLLENKGVIVTVADNGQMAVDIYKNSQPNFFKAILMDIRMPIMDGIEAAMAIRKLPREDASTVPIIAMTANALEDDRRKTKEAGMDAHLAKPFDPKELYAIILQLI